jgi:hypothetical protein
MKAEPNEMTWADFKRYVDEALAEHDLEGDVPIAYIDFSYPTKKHPPSVSIGDAGLEIL